MSFERNGRAVVVKHTGSHYLLSKLPCWNPFPAVIKGKLRLAEDNSTNPIAVGDIVEYEEVSNDSLCVIKKILKRNNCVIRRAANLSRQSHVIAANIEMAFLVVTIDFPEIKQQFIDRFLVTCEAYSVPVTIVINKTDLYGEEQLTVMEKYLNIYSKAGYEVLCISVFNKDDISLLASKCKDKVVLFSGQSGVGKSSIIMALDPNLDLKVQEISDAHLQGKHTTTFYQMHPLSQGGFVIDTPGIRGFGLVDFSHEELSNYFPEMFRVEDGCKFTPCTHTHEPGCAVKEAVERGEISLERYESYIGMLQESGKYR